MSKKIARKVQSQMPVPKRVGDIPTTQRHLELVKNELKSNFTTLRLETKSGFAKIDADLSRVQSTLFEMKALLEEQNSRNRVALDGYTVVYENQKTTEERIEKLEKKVFGTKQY